VVVVGTGTVRTCSTDDTHLQPESSTQPSVLEQEAKAPFSTHGHCSQKTKVTILWCVAISPFTLRTCTLRVLPTEIHSALDEKGPILILPAGCVVWCQGGILSLRFML